MVDLILKISRPGVFDVICVNWNTAIIVFMPHESKTSFPCLLGHPVGTYLRIQDALCRESIVYLNIQSKGGSQHTKKTSINLPQNMYNIWNLSKLTYFLPAQYSMPFLQSEFLTPALFKITDRTAGPDTAQLHLEILKVKIWRCDALHTVSHPPPQACLCCLYIVSEDPSHLQWSVILWQDGW